MTHENDRNGHRRHRHRESPRPRRPGRLAPRTRRLIAATSRSSSEKSTDPSLSRTATRLSAKAQVCQKSDRTQRREAPRLQSPRPRKIAEDRTADAQDLRAASAAKLGRIRRLQRRPHGPDVQDRRAREAPRRRQESLSPPERKSRSLKRGEKQCAPPSPLHSKARRPRTPSVSGA